MMLDPAAPDLQSNQPPPAETRAERRMRRLEAMAELGVSIGRRLERQAEFASAHAETDIVPDNLPHQHRLNEIARSFAQVCRAVAVATALEDRIDRGLPAVPDLDRARRLRDEAVRDKRAEAAARVEHALWMDPALRDSPKQMARCRLDLDRLLDRESLDLDLFLDRPLSQIVARVRRNLGLPPAADEAELWSEAPEPPSPAPAPATTRGAAVPVARSAGARGSAPGPHPPGRGGAPSASPPLPP